MAFEDRAVFIGGYPKSGTTLLLATLDGHPQLLVFPEETFFGKLWGRHHDDPAAQVRFIEERTFRPFWEDPAQREARLQAHYAGVIDYPELKAAFDARRGTGPVGGRELFLAVILAYQDVVRQSGDKVWWAEKTPGHEHHADRFLAWFPEARFIYCIRDPREVYASYRKKRSRFDRVDLPLPRFLRDWRVSVEAGIDLRARLGPERVFWLRYEDFVRDPRSHQERLCAFLGIGFDPILLTPTRNGQPWGGNSMSGAQFTGIVDTTRRGAASLPPDDLIALEAMLEPILVRERYRLRTSGRQRLAYRSRQVAARWQNSVRGAARRLVLWRF